MRIVYLIRAIDKQDDDGNECGMDEPSGTQKRRIWVSARRTEP